MKGTRFTGDGLVFKNVRREEYGPSQPGLGGRIENFDGTVETTTGTLTDGTEPDVSLIPLDGSPLSTNYPSYINASRFFLTYYFIFKEVQPKVYVVEISLAGLKGLGTGTATLVNDGPHTTFDFQVLNSSAFKIRSEELKNKYLEINGVQNEISNTFYSEYLNAYPGGNDIELGYKVLITKEDDFSTVYNSTLSEFNSVNIPVKFYNTGLSFGPKEYIEILEVNNYTTSTGGENVIVTFKLNYDYRKTPASNIEDIEPDPPLPNIRRKKEEQNE